MTAGLARAVSSCVGVGWSPVAPGTAASLLALLVGAGAMLGPPWLLGVMAAAAVAAGLLAIPAAGVERGADPGWVVIDEVAGQWIAMLGLGALTPWGLAGAFGLFRLLDIGKPGPVGWADRQEGAWGIMGDDVIAGGIAALVLLAVRRVGGWS